MPATSITTGSTGSGVNRLNQRQREVLHLVCRGLRNSEIGSILHLSERTVKWYVSQLFLLFDVSNRTELAAACAREEDALIGAARARSAP